MKKLLALVLALVMTLGLATVGANAKGLDDFPDKASVNYEEAASVMHAVGIFMGDQNGEFRATAQLTRAEAAKIIAYMMLGNKAAESVVPSGAKFKDVPASHWAAKYIEYLASVNIMQGDESGRANPDSALTAIDFAKMLLVSLGYDPKVEGLVGVDYRINTSKLANMDSVKLFDGNPDVVATNPVTREEAALYTFNTIKAPLVEYSSKGSTLTVNGAELNFGASNYKYVVSTIAEEQRISKKRLTNTGTTSDGGYTVEFGERYYPKLKLNVDEDAFGRPANKWIYDNKDVGTFVQKDKLIASYTTSVNGKTLFELLGKARIEAGQLTYKVDGAANNTILQSNMTKGNTVNYGTTGKGVLTEVYGVGDDLIIVSINTYMAKAKQDYNSAKDQLDVEVYNTPAEPGLGWAMAEQPGVYDYMTINTPTGTSWDPTSWTNPQSKIQKQVKGEDFANAKEYKKDTPLNVTIALDGGVYKIQSIGVPEYTQNATITEFSSKAPQSSSYLTTDGAKKDYAKKLFIAPIDDAGTPNPIRRYSEANSLTDYTYNICYDQYGYVIGLEVYEGETKYVFLTAFNFSGSNLAAGEATGFLIFNDGTTKTAKINTDKTNTNITNYNKKITAAEAAQRGYLPLTAAVGDKTNCTGAQYNMWFKFSVNDSGVYTLNPVDFWLVRENQPDVKKGGAYTTKGTAQTADTDLPVAVNPAAARVDAEYGRTAPGMGTIISGYGNDDTVYITVESGEVQNAPAGNLGIKKVTGTYTGLQKVDLKPFPEGDKKALGTVAFATATSGATGGIATDHNFWSAGDVFAVLNNSNYMVAAIVVGESLGTANYAYVVKTALKEYVKDGKYYWDFQAIHEGELKTMTVKEEFDKAVSAKIQRWVSYYPDAYIRPAVFELKLDKDGFVVGADPVSYFDYDNGGYGIDNGAKLYGQSSHNWSNIQQGLTGAANKIGKDKKIWETYNNSFSTTTTGANTGVTYDDVTIKAVGRTLYTVNDNMTVGVYDQYDIGLTVAPSAPIFVIQRTYLRNANGTITSKDNPSVEQYSDLSTALASMGDELPAVAGQQFSGVISAALDDIGRAKWLVLKSSTPVVIGDRDNGFAGLANGQIGVTSANGRYGYPREGDMLQVTVPATNPTTKAATSNWVTVTTVVGGAATTTVEYNVPTSAKGNPYQLPVLVTAGVSYQVVESNGSGIPVTSGVAGTGIANK